MQNRLTINLIQVQVPEIVVVVIVAIAVVGVVIAVGIGTAEIVGTQVVQIGIQIGKNKIEKRFC
jgi:hypothetical protein